jgi:hypothetical protein
MGILKKIFFNESHTGIGRRMNIRIMWPFIKNIWKRGIIHIFQNLHGKFKYPGKLISFLFMVKTTPFLSLIRFTFVIKFFL